MNLPTPNPQNVRFIKIAFLYPRSSPLASPPMSPAFGLVLGVNSPSNPFLCPLPYGVPDNACVMGCLTNIIRVFLKRLVWLMLLFPATSLVLAGSPMTLGVMGCISRLSPRVVLRPLMFVYCPECHSGIFVFPPSVLLSRFPSREIPAFTPYTFHSTPEKSPQKAILFAYMQKKLYLCALKYVFFNWEAEYEEK